MLIGLATFMFAPINTTPQTIVDEFMEADIQTRTKEVKLIDEVEEVEFVSAHQEEIIEVEEEVSEWVEVSIHVSYYTDLPIENTPNKPTTDAQGNKLKRGTIAIPRDLPLGTTFIIDGFNGEYVGRDRGSKKYIRWIDNNTMKIDMYIPRKSGESDGTYYRRVNNMGITKTTGRYLIPKE